MTARKNEVFATSYSSTTNVAESRGQVNSCKIGVLVKNSCMLLSWERLAGRGATADQDELMARDLGMSLLFLPYLAQLGAPFQIKPEMTYFFMIEMSVVIRNIPVYSIKASPTHYEHEVILLLTFKDNILI